MQDARSHAHRDTNCESSGQWKDNRTVSCIGKIMVKHNMTGPDRHQELVEVMSLATHEYKCVLSSTTLLVRITLL